MPFLGAVVGSLISQAVKPLVRALLDLTREDRLNHVLNLSFLMEVLSLFYQAAVLFVLDTVDAAIDVRVEVQALPLFAQLFDVFAPLNDSPFVIV